MQMCTVIKFGPQLQLWERSSYDTSTQMLVILLLCGLFTLANIRIFSYGQVSHQIWRVYMSLRKKGVNRTLPRQMLMSLFCGHVTLINRQSPVMDWKWLLNLEGKYGSMGLLPLSVGDDLNNCSCDFVKPPYL